MPGEFDLIRWIQERTPSHPRVSLGIGDDAACLDFPEASRCLITTDMLMERVDFILAEATPYRIGWKALGVNLSDIAAMGGKALAAVVSYALPKQGAMELAQGIQAGLEALAREFSVAIIGGDTNTWDGPLVISLTVLGEPLGTGPIRRDGALPGDWIMVTGELGGSILGHHLDFTPRLREAAALQSRGQIHSMIDISDGLAADLHHLLDASGVGAIVHAESLPIRPAASSMKDGRTPLQHALSDGEDFELLFTVSPELGRDLLAYPPFVTRLTHIGEMTRETGCWLVFQDKKREELPSLGWKHPFSDDPQ